MHAARRKALIAVARMFPASRNPGTFYGGRYATLGANVYRWWLANRERCAARLTHLRPLTEAERTFATRWSQDRQEFGWNLIIVPVGGGDVLELHGDPNGVPDWVIYAVQGGFRSDEFSGESWIHPTLKAALEEISRG